MEAAQATVIAASIAAMASLFTAGFTFYHNRKTLLAQRTAEKRRQLNAALQELLLPLYSYLMSMQAVFKIFFADKPKEFRTLEYLLDPKGYAVDGVSNIQLSDADKKLLGDIVTIGKEIEKLILAKGSLVDDPILHQGYTPNPQITDVSPEVLKGMGLFALGITHLRLFRLAWEGALTGNPSPYKAFVYPRELNIKVYEAIQRCRSDLASLE